MQLLNDLYFLITNYYTLFLDGIKITLILASVGTAGGVIIGLAIYFFKSMTINFKDNFLKRILKRIFSWLATAYVDIIRGTPMIVQASIFYYGFAARLNIDVLAAALIIVSFNTAAYIAEIIRSGVISLGDGSLEAAQSLGLSRFKAMRYVIFPQVLKNSLPSLLNELIVNVKDSAVLSVIGLGELFYSGRAASSENYMQEQTFLLIAIIYFIITFSLSRTITYLINRTTNSKTDFQIKSIST